MPFNETTRIYLFVAQPTDVVGRLGIIVGRRAGRPVLLRVGYSLFVAAGGDIGQLVLVRVQCTVKATNARSVQAFLLLVCVVPSAMTRGNLDDAAQFA